MQKSDELLRAFLNGAPESTHQLDKMRFVAYVLACIHEKKSVDIEAIRNVVGESDFNDYELAIDWIAATYSYIRKKGVL